MTLNLSPSLSITPSVQTELPHSQCARSGHNHPVKVDSSGFDTFMTILEKVSAVALAAFAAYTNWQLFIPFFIMGIAIGIYDSIKNKPGCNGAHSASCCLGFLEKLTGVTLPPLVSVAANVAAMVCHIDHHANVFVPVVAISVGMWAGKLLSEAGSLAYRAFSQHSLIAISG